MKSSKYEILLVCVCILALGIHRSMRMRSITSSYMTCLVLPYFSHIIR